jgi:hypothetical protein
MVGTFQDRQLITLLIGFLSSKLTNFFLNITALHPEIEFLPILYEKESIVIIKFRFLIDSYSVNFGRRKLIFRRCFVGGSVPSDVSRYCLIRESFSHERNVNLQKVVSDAILWTKIKHWYFRYIYKNTKWQPNKNLRGWYLLLKRRRGFSIIILSPIYESTDGNAWRWIEENKE